MVINPAFARARARVIGCLNLAIALSCVAKLNTVSFSFVRLLRQWQAMSNYARRYQLLPFVSYVSLIETMPGQRGVSKMNRKEMAKEATEKGVILASINLID
ncbi:MAG: hypothetical protein WBV73_05635 [Phormidium sp.]